MKYPRADFDKLCELEGFSTVDEMVQTIVAHHAIRQASRYNTEGHKEEKYAWAMQQLYAGAIAENRDFANLGGDEDGPWPSDRIDFENLMAEKWNRAKECSELAKKYEACINYG